MPPSPDPSQVLATTFATTLDTTLDKTLRADRGRILAALLARVGDFGLAEEALQQAAASALQHWGRSGVPDRPEAWLIRVAFRKAIDQLRLRRRDQAREAAMAVLARDEAAEDPEVIPDERLRLIFTCCHPALEPKTRVALTLRTIVGLSVAEIARAFLDKEATMAQRLSRARTRLSEAGIPFRLPEAEDWDDRLQSVLAVVYLIFNAGYSSGPQAGHDLCEEAIFLARLIDSLRPGDAEVEGCLALLLLTHARRAARIDGAGATVPPAAQNRRLWDAAALAEGRGLIEAAMARRRPGPYQVKAAIAACHAGEAGPDWPQIAALYASLFRMEPTPVVQLNRAVALAETGEVAAALTLLQTLAGPLAQYQPYHAARAEYLARDGQTEAARLAYDRAIALATSPSDVAFLRARRAGL